MENWEMTSFKITKTVVEKKLGNAQSLPSYSGELEDPFSNYPNHDHTQSPLYFKAPQEYLRNQLKSYGGELNYLLTYKGMDESVPGVSPPPPDVLMVGNGEFEYCTFHLILFNTLWC